MSESAADTSTANNPHARSVLQLAAAMFRYALWPAIATVILAAIVCTALLGLAGLLSALIGGVVAFGSSVATLWLMRKTSAMDPMLVMAAALGGFVFKMLVLLGVMTALGTIDGLDRTALALSMLAVILVWTGAEAVAFQRTKIPTIIPNSQ